MRQTTKIVLGIIISLFLIVFFSLIGISFQREYEKIYEGWQLEIAQENIMEVPVEDFKVIVLADGDINNKEVLYRLSGNLSIRPLTDDDHKQTLWMPEELKPYVELSCKNDSLKIQFDSHDIRKYFENIKAVSADYKALPDRVSGINFIICTEAVDVINKVTSIDLDVKGFIGDQMNIACGNILVDSCQIHSISSVNGHNVQIKNSKIQVVNLDLNELTWSFDHSSIGVLNLTGSGSLQRIRLLGRDIKELNWYPKEKQTKLELSLPGDTLKLILPEI